jgi:hypothetical protein
MKDDCIPIAYVAHLFQNIILRMSDRRWSRRKIMNFSFFRHGLPQYWYEKILIITGTYVRFNGQHDENKYGPGYVIQHSQDVLNFPIK